MAGVVLNDFLKQLQRVLRHDKKTNNYKIALIRALNDTAINYAATQGTGGGVAVPLRILAEWWVGYYWPFMDETSPVMQGMRLSRGEGFRQDVAFRQSLTHLKQLWQQSDVGSSRPADGMVLAAEARRSDFVIEYGNEMAVAYRQTLSLIMAAIKYPIRYAGDGGTQYQVFSRESRLLDLPPSVVALPNANANDICLVVSDDFWETLKYFSIYVDALCIQEWSVFIEEATQAGGAVSRGTVYQLLTDRPDNRRPLSWERNRIEVLLLEGHMIDCFWTGRQLTERNYDLDHVIPIATYPINELWNLVPADRQFNQHVKKALMPSLAWLPVMPSRLKTTYGLYTNDTDMKLALQRDAERRFNSSQTATLDNLADAVTTMVFAVADSRNTPRFGLI